MAWVGEMECFGAPWRAWVPSLLEGLRGSAAGMLSYCLEVVV